MFYNNNNHDIFVEKLEHYGTRGICLPRLKRYLKKRTQIVKYKEYRSNEMNITTGLPKVSILRPLLFLLYTNDVEKCSDAHSFVLYANDMPSFLVHV